MIVVSGDAGIGKTALLAAARERAAQTGLRVLHARGTELERDAGFGLARRLLGQAARDDPSVAFAAQGRLAAGVLGADIGSRTVTPAAGRQALADAVHGLYWVVANLAALCTLAVVVDDAQWADPASLRFLAYLASSIDAIPVLFIAAMRPPNGEPLTTALAATAGAVVLRPRALSEQATRRLVRDTVPEAGHDLGRACHAATRGNPFLLRELAGTLRATGSRDPADVRELVPQAVVDSIAARIAALPGPARELARAIAVLGDEVLVRHAGALAGLDADEAGEAADVLAAAAIVEARRPLAFVHPIVRGAVYANVPAGQRALAHGQAARLLADEGAPPERFAVHLLETEPRADRWTCEQLLRVARLQRARGAHEAAIAAFRRALLEPPDAAERPALLLELGETEMLAVELEAAVEHLQAAFEMAREPDVRLRAALLLGARLSAQSRTAEGVELLERALLDARGADAALLGEVEGLIINIARFHPPTRRSVAGRAARLRRRVDAGAAAGPAELTAVAADIVMAGESADRTAELSLRALAQLRDTSAVSSDYVVPQAARCLIVSDRLDEAEPVLDAAIAATLATGADYERAPALGMRTELLLRRGALGRAEADGRRAFLLARAAWDIGLPGVASLLAEVLLELGRLGEARAVLEDAGVADLPVELRATYPAIMALYSHGRVLLADGQPGPAAEELLASGRLLEEAGEPNPAIIDWRSRAALALAELGDTARASELVGEELVLARRFGAPRAIGLALRARAAIHGGGEAVSDLEEADRVLDGSPAELVRAHVLADLGAALLAEGRPEEARERLQDAAELAHRCEAAALGEQVRRALHRTGARPRRAMRSGPEALTPAERRVASLAATGMANREIAEQLVVAPRTVEFHLSAIYRKLGVGGRHELLAALGG